jgi:hypothetical protein
LRCASCFAYSVYAPFASTSSFCVAFSLSFYFCQIVEEACALPLVVYATYYANLFAKIAALEAADVANVAKAIA